MNSCSYGISLAMSCNGFSSVVKIDAKGVRNMYSILVVFNKHNTARVASCWFIIYYIQ